ELRLVQQPVEALRRLRGEAVTLSNETITSTLTLPQPDCSFEVIAEFEPGTAAAFGLRFCKKGGQQTTLGYDVVKAELFLDRAQSGQIDFHPAFPAIQRVVLQPENGVIRLHLFVDQASVEVFADDGAVCLTSQIFPVMDGHELEVYAENGSV